MQQESELLLRAIEQQGAQTIQAIERSQSAQREGFRQMADSLDRVGDAIQKQIEQTAKNEAARSSGVSAATAAAAGRGETNWSLLFGIGGLLAAMIVPLYGWQSELARSTGDEINRISSRADALREGVSSNAKSIAGINRDLQEVETQFDAMWMATDIELQWQDRINGLLWNGMAQNKDNQWAPRDYWPGMARKPDRERER